LKKILILKIFSSLFFIAIIAFPVSFVIQANAAQPATPQIVQSSGDAGRWGAIALDREGNPHIAYHDEREALKYASKVGETWQIQTVPDNNGWPGWYNSLVLDARGYPHMSYLDNSGLKGGLRYTYWNGINWINQTVDYGNCGADSSIVLDSNGYPLISYFSAENCCLKFARWNGEAWIIQTVDVDHVAGVGERSSLALDSNGNPHISYWDFTNFDLKYASWTGSSWSLQVVDSAGKVGESTSLKIDSNNHAHISYLDITNQALKYAYWTGENWRIQVVDANVGITGRFQNHCDQTSLALDANNYPHISCLNALKANLEYVFWNGTAWTIQIADASYDVGYWSSLALDSTGRAHISYYDAANQDLRYICSVDSSGFYTNETQRNPSPTPTPTTTPTPTPSATSSSEEGNGGGGGGGRNTNPPTQQPPANTTTPEAENRTIQVTSENRTLSLSISGNITSNQITNSQLESNVYLRSTTLRLTVTGENGSFGFCNITIPKSTVVFAHTPTIFLTIDGKIAEQYGCTQDSDNYYVWFTTHYSTHDISIVFGQEKTGANSLSIVTLGGTVTAAVIVVFAGLLLYRKKEKTKIK
jgi:hypothetical protein